MSESCSRWVGVWQGSEIESSNTLSVGSGDVLLSTWSFWTFRNRTNFHPQCRWHTWSQAATAGGNMTRLRAACLVSPSRRWKTLPVQFDWKQWDRAKFQSVYFQDVNRSDTAARVWIPFVWNSSSGACRVASRLHRSRRYCRRSGLNYMTTSPGHLDDNVGAVWRDVYSTFFFTGVGRYHRLDWVLSFCEPPRQLFGLENFNQGKCSSWRE